MHTVCPVIRRDRRAVRCLDALDVLLRCWQDLGPRWGLPAYSAPTLVSMAAVSFITFNSTASSDAQDTSARHLGPHLLVSRSRMSFCRLLRFLIECQCAPPSTRAPPATVAAWLCSCVSSAACI